MVQQMKMQEAQALAEIPLEETLISESSSDKDEPNNDGEVIDDYDEEEDKAEVARQINLSKRAKYASSNPGDKKAQKAKAEPQKVFGGGQPIIPPTLSETGQVEQKKKTGFTKILGGFKKLF